MEAQFPVFPVETGNFIDFAHAATVRRAIT
jgi:hypothetical protein